MISHLHYTPLIWPLLASAALMAVLGTYALRRLSIPAAGPTALLLFFASAWSICSALRTASIDLSTAIFWYQALFLCILPIPMILLLFALQYGGKSRWLTQPRIILLAAVPYITFLLIITNTAHGLMWSRLWLDAMQIFFEPGPWLWIFVIYACLFIVLHFVIVIQVFLQSSGLLRLQSGTILIAWLMPLVAQGIETANVNPFEPLDFVVLAFSLTGLAYALAIFRFHMLDLMPIAHSAIAENLDDGILVLDMSNRLIHINQAGQRLLNLDTSLAIGQDATQVLGGWQDLVELLRDPVRKQTQVKSEKDTAPEYYDVSVLPLTDFRDFQLGRLIILHNITELKQTQEHLLQQQRTLGALFERERLGWELHDGLSQVLNFVSVQTQAISELIATGRNAEACRLLSRLGVVAQDAQNNVRKLIAGQSIATSDPCDFFLGLRERLNQFSQDSGIPAKLIVPQEHGAFTFAPAVEAQLLSIIQEALVNIRKHARAQHVSVEFAADTTLIDVIIADDGIGFDPAEFDGDCQKYGLRIMQARSAEIGGRMQICTAPREGTQVIVQIPWCKEAGTNAPQSIVG